MRRNKEWQKLEDYLVYRFQEIDDKCRTTKGSGNQGEKGDLKFSKNIGLLIEAKQRELKNVYNEDWLVKTQKEIPFHIDQIAVVFTQNKDKKRRVFMDADEFIDMYIRLWRLENE